MSTIKHNRLLMKKKSSRNHRYVENYYTRKFSNLLAKRLSSEYIKMKKVQEEISKRIVGIYYSVKEIIKSTYLSIIHIFEQSHNEFVALLNKHDDNMPQYKLDKKFVVKGPYYLIKRNRE